MYKLYNYLNQCGNEGVGKECLQDLAFGTPGGVGQGSMGAFWVGG